jgi:hypothetical protein
MEAAMRIHRYIIQSKRSAARAAFVAMMIATSVPSAFAQLDPLVNLKDPIWNWSSEGRINVIIAFDSSERMQRDANGDYYDPVTYSHTDSNAAVEGLFGVPGLVNGNSYRRKIVGEVTQALPNSATGISAVAYTGTDSVAYSGFYDRTRMTVAINGIVQGILENWDEKVARFSIVDMRHANRNASFQATPPVGTSAAPNETVSLSGAAFSLNNENGTNPVYYMNRYRPAAANGSQPAVNVTSLDVANANVGQGSLILNVNPGSPAILPGAYAPYRSTAYLAQQRALGWIKAYGNDQGQVDAPISYLLDDAMAEAAHEIDSDGPTYNCRNTIIILVTGGGEGNTTVESNGSLVGRSNTFHSLGHSVHRMVPVYVVAIAPPAADVSSLKAIAANTYGQYFEIGANSSTITYNGVTSYFGDGINAKPVGYFPQAGTYQSYPVPDVVKAFNWAISDAVRAWTDSAGPNIGGQNVASETQSSTPVVGTVDLTGAHDINNNPLTLTDIVPKTTATAIPQRSNVMISNSYLLPGFQGVLRAFRQFKPVNTNDPGDPANYDASNPLGWKFAQDGTRLWVSSLPAAAQRNIFTVTPDGTMRSFDASNAHTLLPYLDLWRSGSGNAAPGDADATALINYIRQQPVGAILSSTPAVLNPPSLDPPPDPQYSDYITQNANRRAIIFVGANDGMLHAFDARTGVEVWAFIPFNLLPKLKALREGEPVSFFEYFVDSSPKLSDVKIGGVWKTFLMFGEGAGGTFYQTMDVSLPLSPSPINDDVNALLTYFNNPTVIPFVWSFPDYNHFDYTYTNQLQSGITLISGNPKIGLTVYGDITQAKGATATELTIGQTWADPPIGQVLNETSPFIALTGSGFYPHQLELATRNGTRAGTTLYMFKMDDGTVLGSKDVGSDGINETQDDCTLGAYTLTATSCTNQKNALQADVVTAGPGGDKFIGRAIAADLDGNIWSFPLTLDQTNTPVWDLSFGPNPSNRFTAASNAKPLKLPIYNGMAIVPYPGWQMYIMWAQGSDKLPTWCMGGIGAAAHYCNYTGVPWSWADTSSASKVAYGVVSLLDNNNASFSNTFYSYQFATSVTNEEGERPVGSPAVAGYVLFIATNQKVSSQYCSTLNANLYAFNISGGAAYDGNRNGTLDAASIDAKIKSISGTTSTGAFTIDRHVAFGVGTKVELFGDPQGFNNGVGAAGIRFLSWREIR